MRQPTGSLQSSADGRYLAPAHYRELELDFHLMDSWPARVVTEVGGLIAMDVAC